MTKRTKLKPTEVTIREIEQCNPCSSEYHAFLNAIKSNALGVFGHIHVAAPRFGPDDPIPLSLIVGTRPVAPGRMSGRLRVDWLIRHIPRLTNVIARLTEKRTTALTKQRAHLLKQMNALDRRIAGIERTTPRKLLGF